ncbi:MAG: hypothetical protein CMO16_05190, partial [Thaumarchaeota archaeon]|nr:hypothetical protein [Nitrososphaerota archaeon]
MTTEEESHINRTDRNRLGKGIAIIVIVMAIGAGLHFAFSSEWSSVPPRSQLLGITQEESPSEIILTGVIQEFQLLFVESEDLRTLAFNSTAGDQNTNPPIEVNVGDEVVIKAINSGKIPHAFGVVSDPDNPASILFNSALKSTSDPFLRGTEGTITFTPAKEGEYYYICTIPGHAAQGMQGKFIVKKVGTEPTISTPTEPTTGTEPTISTPTEPTTGTEPTISTPTEPTTI